MLSRRGFLQLSLAGLVAGSSLGSRSLMAGFERRQGIMLSAASDAQGKDFIVGFTDPDQLAFQLAVPERCHGGCARPGSDDVVMFARRSGRHFHVVDARAGIIVNSVTAEPDHHFYGHGAFSPDGRFLYLTANHYPSGEGFVQVHDVHDHYRRLSGFPVGGVGPHELRMHPDGETLIIGLGGIKTHPDYDRMKLNLPTMAPALLLMDRASGAVRQRFEPSHHQLSCRHLDVSPDGIVIAGYQYEGPEWEFPPLIARLDTVAMEFSEIALEPALQRSLGNYIASVAISPLEPLAAIMAPRGNRALLLDYRTGEYLRTVSVPDSAGAAPDDSGGFIISSGAGDLYRMSAHRDQPERLGHHSVRWDNHLTSHNN